MVEKEKKLYRLEKMEGQYIKNCIGYLIIPTKYIDQKKRNIWFDEFNVLNDEGKKWLYGKYKTLEGTDIRFYEVTEKEIEEVKCRVEYLKNVINLWEKIK